MDTHPEELFHQLSFYSLGLADEAFTHQHVVDAWAAQSADANTKPIKITFALVGLYLHLEKGFSGRAVQLAHIAMARRKRSWPTFTLPKNRGEISIHHVLAAAEGAERNARIHAWAVSVWGAFIENKPLVELLLDEYPEINRIGKDSPK